MLKKVALANTNTGRTSFLIVDTDDDNKAVNTTSSKNVDKVVEQSDTGDDESKS